MSRNVPEKPAMHRRGLLASLFAGAGTLLAAQSASAPARAAKADISDESVSTPTDETKVVYHLTELDRVAFVLGNIKNHYEGVGGPDNVNIALVVHGPALKAFHANAASNDIARRMSEFVKAGLRAGACGNTMKAQNVDLGDLLPGFTVLEQGGVVRLAQLQARGWVYLRP